MAEPEIKYNSDGNISSKIWLEDGGIHRLDGPAALWYYRTGEVITETWFRDGIEHREDGPAYTVYGKDGSIKRHEYYLHGKRYTKLDFMLSTASCEEEKILIILQYG